MAARSNASHLRWGVRPRTTETTGIEPETIMLVTIDLPSDVEAKLTAQAT